MLISVLHYCPLLTVINYFINSIKYCQGWRISQDMCCLFSHSLNNLSWFDLSLGCTRGGGPRGGWEGQKWGPSADGSLRWGSDGEFGKWETNFSTVTASWSLSNSSRELSETHDEDTAHGDGWLHPILLFLLYQCLDLGFQDNHHFLKSPWTRWLLGNKVSRNYLE